MSSSSWPVWASCLFVVCSIGCAPERSEMPASPNAPAREATLEVVEPQVTGDDVRAPAVDSDQRTLRAGEVFEQARRGVLEGARRASLGRVANTRARDELGDALARLDARITSARVDHLRGRMELDSIEVEQLEVLHTRCHRLMGSLELAVDPSVDELDRSARALEREVGRALASWPGSTRGG